MSECLLKALLNCKTFEELEHVVRNPFYFLMEYIPECIMIWVF